MHRTILFLCFLFVTIGSTTAAKADKKLALVVGNAKYQKVSQLANPTNDAADVSASFKSLGFTVMQVTNGNHETMRLAIGEFTRLARGAETAVIFYSGHGMEIAGENWLIPVDAELQADTDAETQAINLRTLTLAVTNTKDLGLVMLDACRDNPFAAKIERTNRTRAVAQGLVRIEPTGNVMVVYAARDGTTAADGTGRNSPFSHALLQHMRTPGLEIVQLFRNVRDDVMTATNNKQEPFIYGTLSKRLSYFKPPAPADEPKGEDEIRWRILRQTVASAAFDQVAQPSVKNAAEAVAIEQFLKEFPRSKHVPEAAARLRVLADLIKKDPPGSAATEDEVAWRNLGDLKSGKLFPEYSPPRRFEMESRGLEEFRVKYPQSRHRPAAEARLVELKALISSNPSPSSEEEVAWRALVELEAGKIFSKMPDQQRLVVEASSLEEFIRRFPKSQHIADASVRLGRLEKLLSDTLQPTVVPGGGGVLADDERFITELRAKPAQLLNARQRARLASIAGRRAALDLEIPFDYNSANISRQAIPVLRALGRVLGQSEFSGTTFLIGGHTDASGKDEYNQDLSERRAEAVKRLLIEEFRLTAANFIAAGFGKDYPKSKSNPLADENRRVAVVNMSSK